MPTFEEQKRVKNLFRIYRSQGLDKKAARAKAEADVQAESKPVAPEDNNLGPMTQIVPILSQGLVTQKRMLRLSQRNLSMMTGTGMLTRVE